MELINYDSRQPYEDFGNAIIVRACDDYVDALKELKKPKPNDPKRKKVGSLNNIMHFKRYEILIVSLEVDYIHSLHQLILIILFRD